MQEYVGSADVESLPKISAFVPNVSAFLMWSLAPLSRRSAETHDEFDKRSVAPCGVGSLPFSRLRCGIGPGHAQEAGSFPSRPVKIVVPYAAGATTDILARTIAKTLEETWKQRVYVENQAGGGGLTGAGAVSRSAPDGHTLVVVTSAHVIGPTVMKNLPFDPIGAFAPITSLIQASRPS